MFTFKVYLATNDRNLMMKTRVVFLLEEGGVWRETNI
jgi:hypothetical protein